MTTAKILSLLALVSMYGSSVNAAAFPPLIDGRVTASVSIEVSQPEIILPEGSYADMVEIGDIDNDGIKDYQFIDDAFYDNYYSDDGSSDDACPSLYIAASSVVGSSFAPSDAVEVVGVDTLYSSAREYFGCLLAYALGPEIIPDLNNDGINELLFYGEYAYIGDDSEAIGNTVFFGSIESGSIIDVANALDNGEGFELALGLSFQNLIGDINGDGFADPVIIDYEDDYYYIDGSGQRLKIINGASLASVRTLTFDTLSDENVLIEFNVSEFVQLTGGADFNGDALNDIVITNYDYYSINSTYVLYGANDLQTTVNDLDSTAGMTQLPQCFAYCEFNLAGDFNADGFDDAFLGNVDGAGENNLIVYGSSVGLPSSIEPDTSTRVFLPEDNATIYTYVSSVGDVNGDNASDLLFDNYGGLTFLLLGQAVADPEDIIVDQLNGENGFQIIQPDEYGYYFNSLADANADGLDDIVGYYSSEVFLLGRRNSDDPQGIQGLSVATGQTMTFLSWFAPDAASNVDTVEIYVNDNLIDTVDATTTYYQFSEPAPDSTAVLRLQNVTNENRVSPALDVPLSNDFQALRQLSATVYSGNTLELSWENEPSDYVVWRDGAVLAQISGNSYIDSDVQPDVEYRYHVTQGSNAAGLNLGRSTTLPEIPYYAGCTDYCYDDSYGLLAYDYEYGYDYYYDPCGQAGVIDDRPSVYRARYPASTDQLLVTTNTAGVEFSTPAVEIVNNCNGSGEFRTNSAGYQLYSTTALELFWERATHVSGVVAYEVSLFDQVLSTLDATSYFVDDLGGEVIYEYKVTAIAGDGSRSIPSVYSIYLPHNDQNYIDELSQPPPSVYVSSDVYSSTAAELFWQMDYDNTGTPLTYRVTRNGELLLTTDAQSYFDDSLQPGTTYTYVVVTVSQAGLTGEAFVLEINTPSEGGNSDVGSVVPTGARGIVYSNSALEIFWDRSTDSAITGYVIFRNDEQINSTDGITFYDSDLAANSEYRYSIQATDSDGNIFGEQALVVLRTAQ